MAVKMELMGNGFLKVYLMEEDLFALGLTFDGLDYDNPATKEAIQAILLAAREETGFDAAGGLVVEAIPVEGGCLMLFTPTAPHRRVRLKRAVGPFVYEAEDAEQLFRLADGISRLRPEPEGRLMPWTGSSLYQFGEKYRLVLYPSASLPKGVGDLLQEFVRTAGEGDAAAAYTAEHGRAIAVGDALTRLCSAVGGRRSV